MSPPTPPPIIRAEPSIFASTREMRVAETIANETAHAMMAELCLRYPAGDDVQGVAFVVANFRPIAQEDGTSLTTWTASSDNLDSVNADTLVFGALLDFIRGLEMPEELRQVLCERIMEP